MVMITVFALILATVEAIQGHTFQGFASWLKFPCCSYEISARGGYVLSRHAKDDDLQIWNGTAFVTANGHTGISVSASPDGWHWSVGKDFKLYRWNKTEKKWDHIPGQDGVAQQVSALSMDTVLVRKADNSIAFCDNGTCTPMKGLAIWVSIGFNDTRWMIGHPDKRPWRWNHATKYWDAVPRVADVEAKMIDVVRPNAVVMTGANDRPYVWENGNWSMINNWCHTTVIDEGKMWCVHNTNVNYGEFAGPYPEPPKPPPAAPPRDNSRNAEIVAALNSGQCQVTVTCPYGPGQGPAPTPTPPAAG